MEKSDNNIAMDAIPDWQKRLIDERVELLERVIKLKNKMDDPDFKLNSAEWEMLRGQFYSMRDYLQALTSRCVYYKLIPAADLGINYDKHVC